MKQTPSNEPYSKVVRRMWGDQGFTALSNKPSGRLLWLYLLTGPDNTVIPGLMPKMGLGTLADRLEWPYPAVTKYWKEIEKGGLAMADWKAGVIWLPNAIHQPGNAPVNPNQVTAWRAVPLPECWLVVEALSTLRARLACLEPTSLLTAFDAAFKQRFPSVCAMNVVNGSGNSSTNGYGNTDAARPLDASNCSGNCSENGSANGSGNQEQDQVQDQDLVPPYPPCQGGVEPSTGKPTREERAWASSLIHANSGRCPHTREGDDACVSQYACIGKLVMKRRQHEAAGMSVAIAEEAHA